LGGSAENRVSIEKRLKELGIARVVRLQGFVNATEEFDEHPQVLNGCSDLMVEVFGERGMHARSVLGAVSVRANLPVIIESQFEVR
jgi:enamine deaminase RidA (YjgF/YER057c/UK114 family)